MTVTFAHYLTLSAFLFVLAAVGLLTRRHGVILWLSGLLMTNAAQLVLVASARFFADAGGQRLIVLSWLALLAQAALGLAVLRGLIEARGTDDVQSANYLKG